MQAAHMALVVPVAWVAAEYAEGAYHRASGHHDAALGGALQRAHDEHHCRPVDASDDEYFVVVATMAVVVALLIARRPGCQYMRGALDAVVLVALVFPYVSWMLHAAYHDPDTVLLALGRPFTERRARHRLHHASGGRCNYGITGNVYDYVHGTYADGVYLNTDKAPVAARSSCPDEDKDKKGTRGSDSSERTHNPSMAPKVAGGQCEHDKLHRPADIMKVDPSRDPITVVV